MKKPQTPSANHHPAPQLLPEELGVAAMIQAFYDAAREHDADGVDVLRAAVIIMLGVTRDTGGNIDGLCSLLRKHWPRIAAAGPATE